MMLTSRHLLTAAAAFAAQIPAQRVWAASALDLGSIRIETLCDGNPPHVNGARK